MVAAHTIETPNGWQRPDTKQLMGPVAHLLRRLWLSCCGPFSWPVVQGPIITCGPCGHCAVQHSWIARSCLDCAARPCHATEGVPGVAKIESGKGGKNYKNPIATRKRNKQSGHLYRVRKELRTPCDWYHLGRTDSRKNTRRAGWRRYIIGCRDLTTEDLWDLTFGTKP